MHCARVCKQTSPIRGQASAVTTCNCQWPGRAHGGLSPPVLRHRLSLGSIKVSSIKKNSSARNEIDNVPEGKYVADKKHQDQTLSSERLVADTSDEDSNLPGTVVDGRRLIRRCNYFFIVLLMCYLNGQRGEQTLHWTWMKNSSYPKSPQHPTIIFGCQQPTRRISCPTSQVKGLMLLV